MLEYALNKINSNPGIVFALSGIPTGASKAIVSWVNSNTGRVTCGYIEGNYLSFYGDKNYDSGFYFGRAVYVAA